MYYYLTAIAFVSYILYKCYIYPLYLSPLLKVPGPPVDNFLLGHYASILSKNIKEAFYHLVKQYGGIVKYHGLLSKPYILVADPKLVQEILSSHSYEYPRDIFNKPPLKDVLGEGLLFADGNVHKRQRRLMSPLFAYANIKEMLPTIVQAGHRLKDIWIKQIGNEKSKRITVTELIPKTTLDIIGLVGFNYEFNSTTSESELAQAYNALANNTNSSIYLALLRFFPSLRKIPTSHNNKQLNSIKTINNTTERLIAEQRSSLVRGTDLLSLLVKANDSLPVDQQLTHKELTGQTTSTAISWALYFLAKSPDAQDRLRKEVLEILVDRDHCPTFDEIEHMKYLDCVFKEALRLIPPGINTSLWIPIYAIHRNPLIWGDDAEHFNPSRWLNPELKSKITNYTYLPFGAGPQNCVGMRMAHLELKTILSIIIRNFEFRSVEGFSVRIGESVLSKPIPGVDLMVSKVDC
ncbi:17170_t:CDS:2 [Racocetra fulgida]|uniref:17170_t:CDS:1 n=1 Tax=Racocetra fulgida TaxID=60492 RepID=A0A9N9CCA4_9GLOM|nr:17170_t:CDS:2 [Racocetra fulgida]